MPLITCPDCNKEVSDQAKSCPNCGHPIAAITIEQTGKQFKGLQLASVFAIIIGVIFIFAGIGSSSGFASGFGFLLFFGGIALYLVARFGAWWHHG